MSSNYDIPLGDVLRLLVVPITIISLILALVVSDLATGIKFGIAGLVVILFIYFAFRVRPDILPYVPIPWEFKITLEYTGIEHGSPTLAGSDYEEEKCLECLDDRLQFMGVHGSRWIDPEEGLDELFEESILEARNNSGKIRFLIVNPDNEEYLENKPENGDNRKWVYDNYAYLQQEYPETFEVRLYDKLPNFRIATLDRTEAYISRYFFNAKDADVYEDQPMVELNREPEWSFVESYLKYFELHWEDDTTKTIDNCNLDAFDIEPENAMLCE